MKPSSPDKYIDPLTPACWDAQAGQGLEPAQRLGWQTADDCGLPMLMAAAALLFFSFGGDYAQAQPMTFFHSLYSLTNGPDGAEPYANLIPSGSSLYGTASAGGANGSGTVFALNKDGTSFRTLYSFSETVSSDPADELAPLTNIDGANPYGGLVLSNNTLYGTTLDGGTNGWGTVFAVKTDGTGFTVLHTFTWFDGYESAVSLVLSDNRLYGTTVHGGTNDDGVVFSINTDGTGFTTLHLFTGGADGLSSEAPLVLSAQTLYGTAVDGGTNAMDAGGGGTVFAVNTDGTSFSILHNFDDFSSSPPSNSDGANPSGELVLSSNTLYGTTIDGGTNSWGTVFAVMTDGTGFRQLHAFSGPDGSLPSSGLVLVGNTLYGTTTEGGSSGNGTVFGVNTDGTGFTILHNFLGSDGTYAWAGLVSSRNTLYGTTKGGGSEGAGTIFAITLPSGPAIYPNSVAEVAGQLQFVAGGLTTGATVVLQASSDPSPAGNWVAVATNTATGANMSFSGLSVTNANYGFFRVLETSPP
jgi:uncharacterized repeat protein (TIGR03803 family)